MTVALGRERGSAAARIGVAAVCAVLVWVFFVQDEHPADLMVFLDSARAVARGASPYVDPSSPAVWSGHAFVYPYFTAWLFVPLSGLSVTVAGVAFYLLSVAALLIAVRLFTGTVRVPAVLLALGAEPVVRALQLGTLNVWLMLGLAVAWRYRDQRWTTVAALSVVIVAKLFLLPMIAWLLISRRVGAGAATVACCAVLVTAGCVAAGISPSLFVHMMAELTAHEGPHSSSLTALLAALHVPTPVTLIVPALAAGAVIGASWLRFRRTGDESLVFCGCVVASIVMCPIVWSHYFTLLLVIPLARHWRRNDMLVALAVSWLVGTPNRAPALAMLHPFPGAGWVWAVLVVGSVHVGRRWRRRARTSVMPESA